MKKILFFLAMAVLCLASCSKNKNACKIEGLVENPGDCKMVYFQRLTADGYENLDSCALNEEGHFHFSLKGDSALIRFVGYNRDGEDRHQVLFVEPGELFVSLGEGESSVKGSPENERLAVFTDEVAGMMLQTSEIEKRIATATDMTEEEKTAVYADLEKLGDEINEKIRAFIMDNIQTPAGLYMLRRNRWRFEAGETMGLLESVTNNFDFYGYDEVKFYVDNYTQSAVGQPFIDVTMNTPEGMPFSISEVMRDNKVVLIDFWASWCGPCRREMPHLVELYERYHDKGFEILGISVDDDLEAWKKGIETLHITWPQISALNGWKCEAVDRYAIIAVPTMLLVDVESGKIIARDIYGEEIDNKLAELLK